jgi:hypothetical protein
MRPLRSLLVCAALALACNPYDPDLGDTPFRCGTDEPRCPDGYVAVEESVVRCICERAATAPDGGPSDYVCDGDPFENPNAQRRDPVRHAGRLPDQHDARLRQPRRLPARTTSTTTR